jgi:hypothetical protein
MPIIAARNLSPRMMNYRRARGRRRGLGTCTAADPSGCAGPYSTPMYNYDYQLNQQSSGGVNETPVWNPPPAYVPDPNSCMIGSGPNASVDSACVARQGALSSANQNAILAAQASYNLQQCLNNGNTPAYCAVAYPGAVASGNVSGAAPPPPPPVAPVSVPAVIPRAPAVAAGAAAGGGLAPSASLPVVTPDVLAANGSTSTGFSLSSLPWWVWAGGAAFGLYAMGGRGR